MVPFETTKGDKVMYGGLKFRDCVRILKRNGFEFRSQNGSHCKFFKTGFVTPLVICDKPEGVNRMMWKRLVKQYNINLNA